MYGERKKEKDNYTQWKKEAQLTSMQGRDNVNRGSFDRRWDKEDEYRNIGKRKRQGYVHMRRRKIVRNLKLEDDGGREAKIEKEGECSNYPPVLQLRHCTAARYPCRLLDGANQPDKASRRLVLARDTRSNYCSLFDVKMQSNRQIGSSRLGPTGRPTSFRQPRTRCVANDSFTFFVFSGHFYSLKYL